MPTQIAIGFSSINDPLEACKAAAIDVKTQLNAVRTDLVILFATSAYANPEGLETVRRILQPQRLIGSITPGIIITDRVETRGIGVLAIISNELHFGAADIDKLGLIATREAGLRLTQAVIEDSHFPQRSAFLFFYDGLRKNGTHLCAGLREGLGNSLPVVGAISMDSSKLNFTRHFYQTKILSDTTVGLMIGGAEAVCISSRHNWKPLGKPRIIDAVDGNIIHTIDKQPASQLYKDYFRTLEGAPAPEGAAADLHHGQIHDIRLLYPLGIGTATPREYLIRIPIDILPDGSIVCQGEIPVGSPVHLMIMDKSACRRTIQDAAMDIRNHFIDKPPKLVLIFETFTRQKVLGHHASHGLHAIRDILGAGVPVFGMQTIAEIAAPTSAAQIIPTQLLNGSVTLLAIG